MALREFVANAIDGNTVAGGSYKGVEFEVVEKPRAKFGHTAVFIEFTPEIEKCYSVLGTMFLHYGDASLLEQKCLPKRFPNEDNVLIYKKGVLVLFAPWLQERV